MGKFSHIWKRTEDGLYREERSFIRWVAITLSVFVLAICLCRNNVFRWVSSGMTVHEQEKMLEYYDSRIKAMERRYEALQNRDSLEMYARERFYLSGPNEQLYLDK